MSDYIYMLESHLSPDQNRVVEEMQAAAGLENVDVRQSRGSLHFFHYPVLIRAEMALQHVYVVAHRVAPSTLQNSSEPRPQEARIMPGDGVSQQCLEASTA